MNLKPGDHVELKPAEFRVLRVQDAPDKYQGKMVTLQAVHYNASAVITGPLILEEHVRQSVRPERG